jgi:hypothetical protein
VEVDPLARDPRSARIPTSPRKRGEVIGVGGAGQIAEQRVPAIDETTRCVRRAVLKFKSAPNRLGDGEGRVDIAAWLRGLGLERYEPAFRDNGILAGLSSPPRSE